MEGQVKLSQILPFSLQFSSLRFLKDPSRISTGPLRSGLIEMQLGKKRRISREEAQKERAMGQMLRVVNACEKSLCILGEESQRFVWFNLASAHQCNITPKCQGKKKVDGSHT